MTGIIAVAPALPLHTAGKYVAGAYIVFLAIVLGYVAIMAVRLSRNERELAELRRDLQARDRELAGADPDADREAEPVPAGALTRPPSGEPGWRAEA